MAYLSSIHTQVRLANRRVEPIVINVAALLPHSSSCQQRAPKLRAPTIALGSFLRSSKLPWIPNIPNSREAVHPRAAEEGRHQASRRGLLAPRLLLGRTPPVGTQGSRLRI